MSDLVRNTEDRFTCEEAHIYLVPVGVHAALVVNEPDFLVALVSFSEGYRAHQTQLNLKTRMVLSYPNTQTLLDSYSKYGCNQY